MLGRNRVLTPTRLQKRKMKEKAPLTEPERAQTNKDLTGREPMARLRRMLLTMVVGRRKSRGAVGMLRRQRKVMGSRIYLTMPVRPGL